MIEEVAGVIASKIKRANPEETHSVEVMTYSLAVILNFVFALLITLIVSWISGDVQKSLISFSAFVALRFFSGGHHLKSIDLCTIVSSAIFILLPFIEYGEKVVIAITILSAALAWGYAPYSKSLRYNDVVKKYAKYVSIALILSNLIVLNCVISSTFLVQSVLLIHRKGGE